MEVGDKRVWLQPITHSYLAINVALVIVSYILANAWKNPPIAISSTLTLIAIPTLYLRLFFPQLKWSELREIEGTEVFRPHSQYITPGIRLFDYIGSNEGYFQTPWIANNMVILNEKIHEKLSPKSLAWLIDMQFSSVRFSQSWQSSALIIFGYIVIIFIAVFNLFPNPIHLSIFYFAFMISWIIGVFLLIFQKRSRKLHELYDVSQKETALEALDYIDRTMNELHPPAPGKSRQLHTAKMRKIIADAEPKELT